MPRAASNLRCAALCGAALLPGAAAAGGARHIVFMFADDFGWDDVSYHGNSQIPTPAIDRLAREGAMLDQYYVQPVCSPTRATFMTGRHVIHTGVYHAFGADSSGDLSLNFTLLPEHLASLGYATHMVGKWHLGFSTVKQTPLRRGFQSFIGYLGGAQDYWLHGFNSTNPGYYLDFWDGWEPAFSYVCWGDDACPAENYSTHVFARRAVQIIEASAASPAPLFLYVAWQSVHCVEGPDPEQLKAPQSYIDRFSAAIADEQRRRYAAMTAALDDGVGNVTAALRRTGMYDSALVVFSSDNGGASDGLDRNMASNWPLRGTKSTLLEGGVRCIGIAAGGAVGADRRGQVLSGLIHVADWFPSLLTHAARGAADSASASWRDVVKLRAGEPPFTLGDGQDVLDYLTGAAPASPRTEVLLEAHPPNSTDGLGNALRVGDWKVVLRTGSGWGRGTHLGNADGWFGGPNSSDPAHDGYALPAGAASQPWTVRCPPPPRSVTDGFACEQARGAGADRADRACLFDLRADPCEQADLSGREPATLRRLLAALLPYRAAAVYGPAATHNPDGAGCPGARAVPGCEGAGSLPPMNCTAKLPCDY